MPTLVTVDGHTIQVPPGVRQRDLDAEHEALVGLGLVLRAAAEQAFGKAGALDVLTRGAPRGRTPVNQLAEVLGEAVSDALCLTADGERALMAGVR